MSIFMVRCYVGGISDEKGTHKIEAKDALEAAESVCGGSLSERGKPGQLRAQVSLLSTPGVKKLFYISN